MTPAPATTPTGKRRRQRHTPVTTQPRGGVLLAAAAGQGLSHSLRVGLAGGIAGAVGTAVLYPVDTAKTLRQANPTRYATVRHALMDLIFPSSSSSVAKSQTVLAAASVVSSDIASRRLRIQKAYHGVLPATLGAIPSSALYFGAYETCKNLITHRLLVRQQQDTTTPTTHHSSSSSQSFPFPTRLLIHGLAAASGNILSSLVFVPKEFWKQQLQCFPEQPVWGVVRDTVRAHGWRGMYAGYQATLMRNVPSAVLRFVMYEELKHHVVLHGHWKTKKHNGSSSSSSSSFSSNNHSTTNNNKRSFSPMLFGCGAVAGAVASGFMTPFDVAKTRIATHTIPNHVGLVQSFPYILKENGLSGLYAGAGSRMVWSGAFSAIGFGTFELFKSLLGVEQPPPPSAVTVVDDLDATKATTTRRKRAT